MNILACGLLSLCLGCAVTAPIASVAEDYPEPITCEQSVSDELMPVAEDEVQPRLFTTIIVGIGNPETNVVEANAYNTFTLFSTTVTVYVYLYSSTVATEDISQMTLEASNYIYDLDQGHELVAQANTNGEKKYWLALAKFQCNGGNWNYVQSDLLLRNADGTAAE